MNSASYTCFYCINTYSDENTRDAHVKKCKAKSLVNLFCPKCGTQLSRLDNLKRHITSCHGKVIVKSFECDKCDKQFSHKANLLRHKKIHKNEK